nr:hypothetical protein Q903MT_gene5980 [Picea sitchensis]
MFLGMTFNIGLSSFLKTLSLDRALLQLNLTLTLFLNLITPLVDSSTLALSSLLL